MVKLLFVSVQKTSSMLDDGIARKNSFGYVDTEVRISCSSNYHTKLLYKSVRETL